MVHLGLYLFWNIAAGLFALLPSVSGAQHPGSTGGGCVPYKNISIYCFGGVSSLDLISAGSTNFFSLNISQAITSVSAKSSWEPLPVQGDLQAREDTIHGMAIIPGKDYFVLMEEAVSPMAGANSPNLSFRNGTFIYDFRTEGFTRISDWYYYSFPGVVVADNHNGSQFFTYGGYSFTASNRTEVGPKFLVVENPPANVTWRSSLESDNPHSQNGVGFSAAQAFDGTFYLFGGGRAGIVDGSANVFGLITVPMSEILVYSPSLGWSKSITAQYIPQGRFYSTATTLSDGNILVYGGCSELYPFNSSAIQPVTDYALLYNMRNAQWTDVSTRISSNSGLVATQYQFARYRHSAVLINDSLFIFFGQGQNYAVLNDFLILNTLNWTMTNSYSPNGESSSTSADTVLTNGTSFDSDSVARHTISGKTIAGIVVGTVVAVIGIIGALLLFIRYKRRNNIDHISEEVQEDNGTCGSDEKIVQDVITLPVSFSATGVFNRPIASETRTDKVKSMKPDSVIFLSHANMVSKGQYLQKPDGSDLHADKAPSS